MSKLPRKKRPSKSTMLTKTNCGIPEKDFSVGDRVAVEYKYFACMAYRSHEWSFGIVTSVTPKSITIQRYKSNTLNFSGTNGEYVRTSTCDFDERAESADKPTVFRWQRSMEMFGKHAHYVWHTCEHFSENKTYEDHHID